MVKSLPYSVMLGTDRTPFPLGKKGSQWGNGPQLVGPHEKPTSVDPPGSPPSSVCDDPMHKETSSERCGTLEDLWGGEKSKMGAMKQGMTEQGYLEDKEGGGSADVQKE